MRAALPRRPAPGPGRGPRHRRRHRHLVALLVRRAWLAAGPRERRPAPEQLDPAELRDLFARRFAALWQAAGGFRIAPAASQADYLILERLGVDAELAFLDDLAAGTFAAECLDRAELAAARDLARRYRDLKLGLADASLLVLAARHRTVRIATLDRTDFLAVRPLYGKALEVLSAPACSTPMW